MTDFATRPFYFGDESPFAPRTNSTETGARGIVAPNNTPAQNHSDAAPGSSSKKARPVFRVHGGNAAVSKPIRVDYDDEDALIIQMKMQGYTDKQTAARLTKEGYTNYQDRTIGSRWTRLRKMLEEEDDKKLDDELSDWHIGEDDELVKAYTITEEKIQEEIQKLYDRRWSQVSNILAGRLRKKKYSGKACQERYEGLQSGTALKAIELDSDQEGRRRKREERIAAARAARAAEKAQNEAERAAQENKSKWRKEARKDKIRQKAAELEKKRNEKSEQSRIKEERRVQQRTARATKQAALKHMKAERDWYLERNRKEKEVYKRLTGRDLQTELKEAKEAMAALRMSGGGTAGDSDAGDSQNGGWIHDYDLDLGEMNDEESNASDLNDAIGASGRSSLSTTKTQSPSLINGRAKYAPGMPRVRFRTPVTKETLQNPRSVLTEAELEVLIIHRGLPRRGRYETHAEMVARLAAADWELIVPDLKDLLRDLDVRADGKKEEMIRRLQEANAAASFQGEMGVRATDPEFMQAYEPYQNEFAYLLEQENKAKVKKDVDARHAEEAMATASTPAAAPDQPDVAPARKEGRGVGPTSWAGYSVPLLRPDLKVSPSKPNQATS